MKGCAFCTIWIFARTFFLESWPDNNNKSVKSMTFLLTSWVPWGSSLHLRRLVSRQHKGGAGLTRARSRPKPSRLTLGSSTPASLKARERILSEILKKGKWQWWPTTVESFVARRLSSLDSSPGHKKRPPSWATFQKELFTTRTKRVQIVSVSS